MSVHQCYQEPVDGVFGFDEKRCRLPGIESTTSCNACELADECLTKSNERLDRLRQRRPQCSRPASVLRRYARRLGEHARILRALVIQVLEEHCQQEVAPLTELTSLLIGQCREPGRRAGPAGRPCSPVHPRHALRGRFEAVQCWPAPPRSRHEAFDHTSRKPPVASRRHEGCNITAVSPAPQSGGRDAQDATRFTEVEP